MKVCCGIIVYNPQKSDIENIKYYSNNFEKVYVYNNTEINFNDINNSIGEQNNNIEIISYGNNDGLSIACQSLCQKSKDNEFDYIILFDQDSRMDENSINRMKTMIYSEDVAIICPQIIYDRKEENINNNEIEYVDWCITSGSMINLAMFGDLYNFDENYFIDRVDKDYCEQVIRSGKKIARINTAFLNQKLGETKMVFNKPHYNHSTLRHYYMFRNRFYYNHKYNISFIITLLQCVSHIKEILLYEVEKKKKLQQIRYAIIDYKNNKMGKKLWRKSKKWIS